MDKSSKSIYDVRLSKTPFSVSYAFAETISPPTTLALFPWCTVKNDRYQSRTAAHELERERCDNTATSKQSGICQARYQGSQKWNWNWNPQLRLLFLYQMCNDIKFLFAFRSHFSRKFVTMESTEKTTDSILKMAIGVVFPSMKILQNSASLSILFFVRWTFVLLRKKQSYFHSTMSKKRCCSCLVKECLEFK